MHSYQAALEAFAKAVQFMRVPIERVEVQSPDGVLPGYLIPSGKAGASPVVIFYNGFDVTKEILYAIIRDEFANRVLDYEVPTAAIVDYLETQKDIDHERIGLTGISLGGYYAPRGAAFEPRIKACVAWGAIWDYGVTWRRRWDTRTKRTSVPFWQLPWVMGTNSMDAALEPVRAWSLDGVLWHLSQPFLIVHGEEDGLVPLKDARRAFESAGAVDKQLRVFTAAEGGSDHVGIDEPDPVRHFVVDWFARRLGTARKT
ncbi:hypothetical protein OIDMADRAFT_35189 [Oidiodendron maius Zn]|uniref:Peptidase S9 prolyl oligopeptidase catalytic domain-containing protein n=1 Tax=Oidiodendron maius (strain Zn) TaxID=913774 RepID=A0A0C3CWT5_OIDMZ|nr:hypothetical protein OIDMADRAFT_35189 [Oidiodendron maius Zn]